MELKYILQLLNALEEGKITRMEFTSKCEPYVTSIVDSNNIEEIKILKGDKFGIKITYYTASMQKQELKITYYMNVNKVCLYDGKTELTLTIK